MKRNEISKYLAGCLGVTCSNNLLDGLLKKHANGRVGRELELIPCTISKKVNGLYSASQRKAGGVNTNAYDLLNIGWSFDEVLKVVDFNGYHVTMVTDAPYFVYQQIATTSKNLTIIQHRFDPELSTYWKPDELEDVPQRVWDTGVGAVWSPNALKMKMRDAGITRKEILDMGADMLRIQPFTIGGYLNNSFAWGSFFKQVDEVTLMLETRALIEKLADEASGVENN